MKVEIKRYRSGKQHGSIRKNVVEIDDYDVWSADWLLAEIAHPLLVKLKEKKQGAPFVEDENVPEELRSTSCAPKENEWDTDDNHFRRWDWALDEMIFAMQEIANDNENEPPYHTKTGTMEFGEIDPKKGTGPLIFNGWESTPESVAANKAYHDRVQNGCRLFGLHFRNLWS